jgi:hypothetical protein
MVLTFGRAQSQPQIAAIRGALASKDKLLATEATEITEERLKD